jgi:hypothetical protein
MNPNGNQPAEPHDSDPRSENDSIKSLQTQVNRLNQWIDKQNQKNPPAQQMALVPPAISPQLEADLQSLTNLPDHRELHHEPESIFPAMPEPRERTAAVETGNPIAEATAAGINSADEPGLEPDQGIHSQTGEPLEPDSGQPQPSANQHEDVLNHPNDGDRLDESIGDGVSRTIPERSIQPNAGADQQESEQFGDPDAQTAQTPEVEDPEVQQIQRHLEIAQTWSDEQLLSIVAAVEDYFRAPPPKPDVEMAQALQDSLKHLRNQYRHLQSLVREQRETLKDLGPAWSWKSPFGSNPKEVQAAEQALEQTKSQSMTVASRIHQTEGAFASWQADARTYLEWEGSDKGQQMHQCREIVQRSPVQERIARIHQAQEQIRQAQEQQRKKQEALNLLKDWKQTAIQLGRPQGYVQRIQEITEDYRQGKPLTENQIERFNQDFADYREQVRQEQAQQRHRGFSR